jgi:hypothetical protein
LRSAVRLPIFIRDREIAVSRNTLWRETIIGGLLFLFVAVSGPGQAWAQSRNLAPEFPGLPSGASIVVMSPDVELFSISAGGLSEPRADWTDAAARHIQNALQARARTSGWATRTLSEDDADELAEISTLHAAVARAISSHHMGPHNLALPTKQGKLDWSLGEAVQPLRDKTQGDYALFILLRDSYASTERKVAMVGMALLFGVGLPGGYQAGYASLVDLQSGRVLWFNQLSRGSGNLREEEAARETVTKLLENFPDH